MAETFNGYHVWLGIPPNEQPPNHYRLLGIALFETDLDVIDHAADRQMAHVRTFQSGRHGALSQQILNELSSARVCLLNVAKKVAYDDALRAKLGAAAKPAAIPLARAVPTAQPIAPPKAVPVAAPRPAPPVSPKPVVAAPVPGPAAPAAARVASPSPVIERDVAPLGFDPLADTVPAMTMPGTMLRGTRGMTRHQPAWQRQMKYVYLVAGVIAGFIVLYSIWRVGSAQHWWDQFTWERLEVPDEVTEAVPDARHDESILAPPEPEGLQAPQPGAATADEPAAAEPAAADKPADSEPGDESSRAAPAPADSPAP